MQYIKKIDRRILMSPNAGNDYQIIMVKSDLMKDENKNSYLKKGYRRNAEFCILRIKTSLQFKKRAGENLMENIKGHWEKLSEQ